MKTKSMLDNKSKSAVVGTRDSLAAHLPSFLPAPFLVVILLATSTCTLTAAVTATNAAPVDLPRLSVFQDDLPKGKDPFFPTSIRRAAKAPTAPGAPVVPVEALLALKGISGPTNRRFALINNQPVAAGENATVRVSNGLVKIRCWEIRESSVIITIDGNSERKELRIREGI